MCIFLSLFPLSFSFLIVFNVQHHGQLVDLALHKYFHYSSSLLLLVLHNENICDYVKSLNLVTFILGTFLLCK